MVKGKLIGGICGKGVCWVVGCGCVGLCCCEYSEELVLFM